MNIFKFEAQRQKAEKLYLALAKAGATLEQLRAMGAAEWDLAARAAQCSIPSIETRQIVIELAEKRCGAVIRSERGPVREYNFSAEIADGLADIQAAAAGATVAMNEFAAAMEPYRPTAEEEDAAAGYDDEDPREAYWRCQGGSR